MPFPRPGGGGGGAVSSVNTQTGAVSLADLNTLGQVTNTHLSSALPFAQGGTANTTAQAAIDALSGVVSSGFYLRGNGTHALPNHLLLADATDQLLAANGTSFLTLAGQSGGQTAAGGTGTTDTLVLKATSAASPAATSDVIVQTGSTQIARFTQTGNLLGGAITTATAGTNNQSLIWDGTNNGQIQAQNSGLAVSFLGTEIATGAAVGANIDLRSSRGTVASPTALQSGDWIAGMHAGSIGATYGTDCGQFAWLATELHSATGTGCQFVLKTTPNTTNTKTVALTVGQDQSLTVVGNVFAPNIIDLSQNPSTTVGVSTAFGGAPGFAVPGANAILTQYRFNGTAGSPTAITSGQTIAGVQYGGAFDTSGSMKAGANIVNIATENWANSGVSGTAAHVGSKLQFQTVPNGTITKTTVLTLDQDGSLLMAVSTGKLGLYGGAGATKQTVTGSKASNAALTSLMAALSAIGLVTDSTT